MKGLTRFREYYHGTHLGTEALALVRGPDTDLQLLQQFDFTPVGLKRLRAAQADTPQSRAAAIDLHGEFFFHDAGHLYDPLNDPQREFTGTDADYADHALRYMRRHTNARNGGMTRHYMILGGMVFAGMVFFWSLVA